MENNKKQYTRNEIKEKHLDKLQEKYNQLYLDYITIKDKYSVLVDQAIRLVFSNENYDVDLMLKLLYIYKEIDKVDNSYINPIDDEGMLKFKISF